MRTTLRSLADVRQELVQIEREFTQLQKRIDAVRECVTDSLTRIFGEERPAFTGLAEQQLIEKIAGRVAARLGTVPKPQAKGEQRYVRDGEAAFFGVSVFTLRSWRGKRSRSGTRLKSAFSLTQSWSMTPSGNRIDCFEGGTTEQFSPRNIFFH